MLEQAPQEAAARVVPLSDLLTGLPAVVLTVEGTVLASRGGFIGVAHVEHVEGDGPWPLSGRVRLLHPDGRLVALAEPRAGLLHPSVVLE